MKHVVTSLVTTLFPAMIRSRSGLLQGGARTSLPAQDTPMMELSTSQLLHVAGGGARVCGPHGSWGVPRLFDKK